MYTIDTYIHSTYIYTHSYCTHTHTTDPHTDHEHTQYTHIAIYLCTIYAIYLLSHTHIHTCIHRYTYNHAAHTTTYNYTHRLYTYSTCTQYTHTHTQYVPIYIWYMHTHVYIVDSTPLYMYRLIQSIQYMPLPYMLQYLICTTYYIDHCYIPMLYARYLYATHCNMYPCYYVPANRLHTYISTPLYKHSLITISHICHIYAQYKHIDIQGINRPIII